VGLSNLGGASQMKLFDRLMPISTKYVVAFASIISPSTLPIMTDDGCVYEATIFQCGISEHPVRLSCGTSLMPMFLMAYRLPTISKRKQRPLLFLLSSPEALTYHFSFFLDPTNSSCPFLSQTTMENQGL